MIFPDPMSWQHFVQLAQISKLPLHEQMQRYNYYLMEQQVLYTQIMARTNAVGGGKQEPSELPLPSNCIEFTVETTTSTYFEFSFNTTGPINFTVDWGDGTTHEDSGFGGYYSENHTYAESNREYVVRVCFDDPTIVTSFDFLGDD